jgi:hypothetical protein
MAKHYEGPSRNAFNTAAKLGRFAAKNDGWMEPVAEARHRDALTDFGQFEQEQINGWEETCHFEHYYGRPLSDLAEQQARRQGLDKADNWETWYYTFYLPLRDEFWECWCARVNLYEFWAANVEKKETAIV